ncbi:molybdopterin-dependent oxidoreductase [Schlegelella sp. S2-27]|uniref:Molybdopterin-dependent oxidoreductase n=1 Tax=Caldimonas mangrovi TaxID=2944811 RepID=A0ABT0YVV2_9BURK|nr:molybdopterin cofactor-binding domain-containing protein [Caldimonas mangrovi]MCM5682885.1 molybdopterin-dependent oxidoreductase [Caldimonas mangrovi]
MNPSLVSLDRRSLLKLAGSGLALAVGASRQVARAQATDAPRKYGGDAMPGGTVDNPLVFISIATDGAVTIVAHRVEMGTGIRTSLPMVVADEMEADWSRVKIAQADAGEAKYGNQNVDGSRSMRHFLAPMRRVGAAARQMLEAAAAAKWNVPLAQVKAVNHEVVHTSSGRRLGYGALAEAAMKQPVPAADALRLKSPEAFRYIGKGKILPVDSRDIVTGRATYGADVRLPGMLYAVVARPPVLGGRVKSFDAGAALAVRGVVKVVEVPRTDGPPRFNALGGIAVVARNTGAAIRGREALKIEWDDGPNASYDTGEFFKTLQAAVASEGKVARSTGDAPGAIAAAAEGSTLQAEYHMPHLAHAPMEPPVAVVQIRDGRAECWAPVQNPAAAATMVAGVAGLKPEQVTVHPTLLGGGFGRKSKPDFVAEAAIVSKAMDGTPVKLQWTREDDLRHDYFHTVSVQRLQGALTADGKVAAWLHRIAQSPIGATFAPNARSLGSSEVGMTAITVPWDVPHLRLETGEAPAHTRIGWFRAVSNVPNAFAVQSFVAELAHQAGRDHKAFLLDLIGPPRRINPTAVSDSWNYNEDPARYPIDTGRWRRVIEEVTRRAGWGRKLPKGRGLGLAVAHSFMTYVAAVVEVEVSSKGEIAIPRVDIAIDCGPVVNPERVRTQCEGGAVMGLGIAMMNEITFTNGRTEQTNFNGYLVPRNAEAPRRIDVWLVEPGDFSVPPGGVGEPPVPPMAPALCNAVFAATGRRIRRLPIGDQLAPA